MGFLRKTIKRIGRGIKKIGKKIGKAFKEVMKPFSKIFNKLGPIGSIAMMMILPGIGTMLSGFGANIAAGASGALGNAVGTAIQFTGNAINYVASAPQKIFGSITDAIGRGWNTLTGQTNTGSWFDNFKKDFGEFDVSETGQQKILELKNKLGIDTTTNRVLTAKDAVAGIEPATVVEGENLTDFVDSFEGPPKPTITGDVVGSSSRIVEAKDAVTGIEPATVVDDTPLIDKIDSGPSLKDQGVFGKARTGVADAFKSVSKVKIPYVGTVGDTAWAANAGLTAYQAYGSVVGADGQLMPGSSSYAYEAQELLGPTGDVGGMYNITAPTWSYDYNQSYTNNMTNAQNVWNNYYGFGQGFDPSATPGYGYGYEQWLLDSMGMRVSGGAP